MTCRICLDSTKEEELLKSKICSCVEQNLHESCLTNWIRITSNPQCPLCKSVLIVEYDNSISLRISPFRLIQSFYNSGGFPFLFPFIISISSLLAVFITDNTLVKILAFGFFVCNFFLIFALGLLRPDHFALVTSGGAVNVTAMISLIILISPPDVRNLQMSWGYVLLTFFGLLVLWCTTCRDLNIILKKHREKKSRKIRKLKI